MTTTEIKCACHWLGCKARLVITDNNHLYVRDKAGEDRTVSLDVLLPSPIAKAIRDAVKAMEDNHDH